MHICNETVVLGIIFKVVRQIFYYLSDSREAKRY